VLLCAIDQTLLDYDPRKFRFIKSKIYMRFVDVLQKVNTGLGFRTHLPVVLWIESNIN